MGEDLGEVAIHAVEGARQAASELGISSDEAAARTAQGALEAANTLGSEEASEVQEALLEQFIDAALSETQPDDEEQE